MEDGRLFGHKERAEKEVRSVAPDLVVIDGFDVFVKPQFGCRFCVPLSFRVAVRLFGIALSEALRHCLASLARVVGFGISRKR